MSIQILEEINKSLNEPNKHYALANIEDLELDANNPRFANSTILESEQEITEQNIIKYLVNNGKLINIMNSIIKNNGLYWEEWLSCSRAKDGKLIVLEGNRRISACKALLDINLIPWDKRTEINLGGKKEDLVSKISTIRVVIYDDSKEAQNYITAKHTNPEIEKWETFEQCNFYYSQFIQGSTLDTLTKYSNVSRATIIKDIKRFGIFKKIFDVTKRHHPTLEIEGAAILPITDKFMPTLISCKPPFGLNLDYNETLYTYSPSPAKADIFDQILLAIGEAFFVRPSLKSNNTEERDNSNVYKISTDEIKSKKKVVALIENDIRIPGLKELIISYNQLTTEDTTDNGQQTKESTTSDQTSYTKDTKESNATSNTNNKSNKTSQASSKKEYEFFENLDFSALDPQSEDDLGLYRVCDEIVKISQYNNNAGYKRFPIAATFLLRSLIEQTLIRQLKKVNEYDKLCKKHNNKTPELGKICEQFLKQYQAGNYKLFSNDEALARLYNQTFSGFGTKDQLDTVVHRPHTIQPDTNFLNALSKQGIKEIIQTIISNIYVVEEADN